MAKQSQFSSLNMQKSIVIHSKAEASEEEGTDMLFHPMNGDEAFPLPYLPYISY